MAADVDAEGIAAEENKEELEIKQHQEGGDMLKDEEVPGQTEKPVANMGDREIINDVINDVLHD